MIIVSDAGPLRYLLLIERPKVLHELYGRVVVPQAVFDELQRVSTPPAVREWMANHPEWIEVQRVSVTPEAALQRLDEGERKAIVLGGQLQADALIMDDRDGRQEAARR